MDWLTILEDYAAAMNEFRAEHLFQIRLAGVKLR
jgi:hypothetical protein